MIQIAVINACSVLTDAQIAPYVAAVQKQVTNDFYPAWGIDARLTFVPKGGKAPAGAWQGAILDDSDEAGALGYHDVTAEGLPLFKVFAATDLKYGFSVSITLSHETVEMLANPAINLLVSYQRAFYPYETGDPVQNDALGYLIDGVRVSDFVLPAYFETFRATGPFDFKGHLSGPLPALAPGGYMAYMDTRGHWHQITAASAGESHAARQRRLFLERPRPGSRRDRMQRDPEEWLRSTV